MKTSPDAEPAGAIEQQESLSKRPVAELPLPVARISSRYEILYANRAAERLLAALGQDEGHLPEPWRRAVAGALAGEGAAATVEAELEDRTTALTFIAAEAGAVDVYGIDVTALRRAEERLQAQTAFLENVPNAVVVWDLESRAITFWNRGAEDLYGWTHEEALGRSAAELLQPEDEDGGGAPDALQVLLRDGRWSGELRQVTKEGRELTVDSRAAVVNEAGRPQSAVVITTDVTEKRELEKQVIRAQRMESIGAVLGGIAHDLNNVLAPVLMSVELLKSQVSGPRAPRILASLEASARRGMDMVRQMLWFSRGTESERTDIELGRLLGELSRIVVDTFPKSIEVIIDYPPDLRRVQGDPTQIYQAMMNLCVNARDAMPEGGRLLLEASNKTLDASYVRMRPNAKPGPYVRLAVTDGGVGIPPEEVERVFEPFFSTKGSTERSGGTGLGLPTVHSIIHGHGGFMEVVSELGKGSTFTFYLPAQKDSVEETRISAKLGSLQGDGEVVLVVDDEIAIREVIGEILSEYGYRTLTAADGAEAVAEFAEHRGEVAVVLMDVAMPVMDGPAAIRAIRRLDPDVPILALSGLAEKRELSARDGTDVVGYLLKPFTAEVLLEHLKRALQGE